MCKNFSISWLLLFSPFAFAQGVTRTSVLKEFSIESMDSAALVFKSILDTGKPICELSGEKVQAMAQVLKELMEEKATQLKKKDINLKSWQKCEQKCHCKAYSNVLSRLSSNTFDAGELKLVGKIHAKADDMNNDQLHACADGNNWFCYSHLMIYLDQSAKDLAPAD